MGLRRSLLTIAVVLLAADTSAAQFATPAQATPTPTTPAPQTPDQSRIPDSVKTRETLTNDSDAAARIDNEPLDPTLKGFFTLPGTTTHMKIGGYARVDVIHDFEPIGNTSEFIVSSIPIDVTGSEDNTRIQARQTRLNFELRRDSERAHQNLRVFFEFDFFGSNERVLNLRHAYGQIVNVLGGFTESTLADADARADTLDHEGPASRVSVRQAQVRYTFALPGRHSLALAIEDPKSDVPTSSSGETVTPRTPWPDFVARYRRDGKRGHVQAGLVLRSIGGFLANGEESAQVAGVGGLVSGSLLVGRRDTIVFEGSGGHGFARYIKDMQGLGLDLARDDHDQIRAVPASGAYIAFQHVWVDAWRSTFVVSGDGLGREAGQPGGTYRAARYILANLLYRPAPNLTVGFEGAFGRYEVQDGRHNSAQRFQFGVQYDLVK